MNTLALLVVTLAVVQSASAVPWWKQVFMLMFPTEKQSHSSPDFCKDYECPEFKVVQQFNGYELREYSPAVWASSKIPEMAGDYWEDIESRSYAYEHLFFYFHSGNALGQEMNMTVPVVTSHAKDEAYMNFLIPSAFADGPPQPVKPNVTIYNATMDHYYVSSFEGFPYGIFGRRNYFMKEFLSLKQKLDNDGQEYQVDPMFFTAIYNKPWDIFGRHNEVWIMKK